MDLRELAGRIAGDVATVLGGNLVGVYLHGSLALGCFNPARSDVDMLVVTKLRMSAAAKRRHLPPARHVGPAVSDRVDSAFRDARWRPDLRRPQRVSGGCAYVRSAGSCRRPPRPSGALDVLATDLRATVACALAAYGAGADEPCPADEVRRFVASVSKLVEHELQADR